MNIGLGVDESQLTVNSMIRNEITLLGSFCYTKNDFLEAVNTLEEKEDIFDFAWCQERLFRPIIPWSD